LGGRIDGTASDVKGETRREAVESAVAAARTSFRPVESNGRTGRSALLGDSLQFPELAHRCARALLVGGIAT
jgi:hypothetical protein